MDGRVKPGHGEINNTTMGGLEPPIHHAAIIHVGDEKA
jgi:hypothetical protein